jgi:hypothetical protein
MGLNFSYALVGLLLGLLALCFSSSETKDVQARLSVAGMAAALFESGERNASRVESIEGLFVERVSRRDAASKRVGIVRAAQGGWAYKLNFGRETM